MQPDWIKGQIPAEDYKKAITSLTSQRNALSSYAKDVAKKAEEFRKERKRLEKVRDAATKTALSNHIVYIINMNIKHCSFELQLRFTKANFIEDLDEKDKEMKEIEEAIQEVRQRALDDYKNGVFDPTNFQSGAN